VPLAQLLQPLPARFAWQMYARAPAPDAFSVEVADGTTIEVDLAQLAAYLRPEIDRAHFLPPHLCRTVPGAVAVRIAQPGGAPSVVGCA
jgi:hypothetical protein